MEHNGTIRTTYLTARKLDEHKRIVFFFTGMKHSGKTSAAMYAAHRTGCRFADSDELVQGSIAGTHGSVREFYRAEGKKLFMEQELQAVTTFLADFPEENLCISLGGGACDNEALMDICRAAGVIIVLREPAEALYSRIIAGGIPPFLDAQDPWGSFSILYEERNALYNAFGDAIIDKSEITVEQMLQEVHQELLRIRERYYGR